MLDVDIADLMGIVPNDFNEPVIRGGAFDDVKDVNSPFGYQKCEGWSPLESLLYRFCVQSSVCRQWRLLTCSMTNYIFVV